jgi:hypothetical protein
MPMLVYLDALLAALAARDIPEIDRLLTHPLARILSPDALADATAERRAAGTGAPSAAPLRLLQLRYRTAQLLADHSAARSTMSVELPEQAGVADRPRHVPQPRASYDRCAGIRHQMELPLTA